MADYVVTLTGKDNLSSTIKNVKQELNSVGKSTENIDKIGAKFAKIQNSTAPLKRQLRDLKALMADMEFKGLGNTEQFTQIAQYAGKVKDAMSDAETAANRFANDNFKIAAMGDALQMVAGAGNIAAGAMGLFGVKNEEVQQAILKVQSAIALLNGVQAIANKLNKDSALMHAIKAARLRTVKTATDAATAAQIKNNAAVLANPYVAAAAAIAALVAGLYALTRSSNNAANAQEKLNEKHKEGVSIEQKSIENATEQIVKLRTLYTVTQDNTRSLKDRNAAATEMKRMYPDILSGLSNEAILAGKAADAYNNIADAIIRMATAEAAYDKIKELTKELLELEEADRKFNKSVNNLTQQRNDVAAQQGINLNNAPNANYRNPLRDTIEDEIKDITERYGSGIVESLTKATNKVSVGGRLRGNTKTNGIGAINDDKSPDWEIGSLGELQDKLKTVKNELQNQNLTWEQIIDKVRTVTELETQINSIQEGRTNLIQFFKDNPNGEIPEYVKEPSAKNGLELAIKIKPELDPYGMENFVESFSTFISTQTAEKIAKQQAEHAKQIRENWMNAADALGSFGDAMSTLGSVAKDEGTQVAGIIAQAIASIALGYAQATAQAGKLGPWGWVAFAASGLAQMMAMISQIKSVTGGYAEGGIIGGTSYSGDKLVARVNSGEMVLNKRQQSNLFNAINSGNIGGGTLSSVSFRLRGSDIYGSLKNYSTIKGKSGINTGIK